MKSKLHLLLLFLPLVGAAQELFKCNDSTAFFVLQKENFYCAVRLQGDAAETDNARVVSFKGYVLQALLISKQKYLTRGTGDIPVLASYVAGETEYYAGLFKEKLSISLAPIDLPDGKKAMLWYFDIPEKVQSGDIPARRQVSVSVVVGEYVYSIGATLFKGQSFEELQAILSELAGTVLIGKGEPKRNQLCR